MLQFKSKQQTENLPENKSKKHFQSIAKTYQSNTESDYTEKIEALGKNFDYHSNSNYYWGDPEFSTFYGTPLYDEASDSQKLALNHLYWIGQYQHTAASEANTMLYNQVTSGVFANINGYDTLCQELALETDQERYHINTFHRIGYQTKIALLGKESLGNPLHKKLNNSSETLLNRFYKKGNKNSLISPKDYSWEKIQDASLRFITKLVFSGQANYYSQFLQEKGNKSIPTTAGGLASITASPSMFKFLTLNWGSSPFLAAQYYSARMIANMSLKAYEHSYFKRFKDLTKNSEIVPVPTEVSYYHLLDESFHTTMSQVIAQDVYKDFAKPNTYEKLLANAIAYLAQRGILGGLSGVLPAVFRDDSCFMLSFYRMLTSPLFNMSQAEALDWMEKCLCHEHDGFHANLKHHQSLLINLQRFFDRLDYLWPINREMQLMAAGGSIEQAIERNISAFQKFSKSVA